MIHKKLVASSVITMVAVLFAMQGCATKTAAKKNSTSTSATSPKKATKGSTAKGPADSKSAGQKTGSTATENKEQAQDQGSEYESATCDAELEGTAWCGDDHTAIFCSDGHWYALDCANIGGDVCAETLESHVVDCDAPAEVDDGSEDGE